MGRARCPLPAAEAGGAPRRGSSRILLAALPFVALLLAAGAYVGRGLWTSNLHEVAPGKLWRSAQMSPPDVAALVREKGIRILIKLRKEDPDNAQHEREEAACREAGAEFVTIPFSPKHLPPPERVRELIAALEKGPFPELLHCRTGADRAGLAGMLYLAVVERRPFEEAVASQLSWSTGHLPIGDGRGVDLFVDLYRETGGGRDLWTWILEDYPRLYAAHHRE